MDAASVLFIGTGTPSFVPGTQEVGAASTAQASVTASDDGGGGGLSVGYIAGISAGAAGVVAVGGGLGVLMHKANKRRI